MDCAIYQPWPAHRAHLTVKSKRHVLTNSKTMYMGIVGVVLHVEANTVVLSHSIVAAVCIRPADTINVQIKQLAA